MKKKLNNTSNISKKYFVSQILKKPMTTRSDLEFLLTKLGIEPFRVVWLKNADPNYREAQVINLGSEVIGGSHWTCTYDGKYFDPFGMVPPQKFEDANYEWIPLPIQDMRYGYCGAYVCGFLYYAKIGEIDKFYNLFNIDPNDIILKKKINQLVDF